MPTDQEIVDFLAKEWTGNKPYEMLYDLTQMQVAPPGRDFDAAYQAFSDEDDFRKVMAMVMGRAPIPQPA